MLKRIFLISIFIICSSKLYVWAEEGMWMPFLLEKMNLDIMQMKGLKLSAEDLFSNKKASLKDAIVLFDNGCTGSVISDDGLLLTNYHCALEYIRSHSSVNNNYLTKGFWTHSKEEELPSPGLTVTFLIGIEEVTHKVLNDIDNNLSDDERKEIINKRLKSLIGQATIDAHYTATVKSFFYDNEYYLYTYEVFKDIRLVGAPPASVGNFGGDTDNWVWPRHTGDFSLFRIYADKNNKPAEYSPDNIPYKPKKYLKISLKGYKEGDLTMVYGYPAKTRQYLSSFAINILMNEILPKKINIREEKQNIIKTSTNYNDEAWIKYATKYAKISNARKKWTGILEGFERTGIIQLKEELEAQFNTWINSDSTLKRKYGHLFPGFEKLYNELLPYYTAEQLIYETLLNNELVKFVSNFNNLIYFSKEDSGEILKDNIELLKETTNKFFKDYSIDIDKNVLARMLEIYYNDVDTQFHPDILDLITKKSKDNFSEYANYVFSKSIFVNQAKVNRLLQNYSIASAVRIEDDPAFQLYANFNNIYLTKISPNYRAINNKLDKLYRKYVEGLSEMQPDKQFYPDANHTMRLSYGNIKGYKPGDAVTYRYYTTLSGILEKNYEEINDYTLSEELKTLFESKDYGAYATNDTLHVCFIASNHTSGGNSGSPVLNSEGQMIGINFDRNWEGTVSDYLYDPEICRNISVDIRYMLFIIDKYANAGYLLDEMSFVK